MAPKSLKRLGRRAIRRAGLPTAALRMVPDVVVAGASRSGTTSLHRALLTHPGMTPPVLRKGVHYFDVDYDKGMSWYRSHFPLRPTMNRRPGVGSGRPLCFESSGYYMHHPLAPERMARDLPGVRLVVMLRDPVERAYSAYKHEFARGFEPIAEFEQALASEAGRLLGEVDRITTDAAYVSHAHRHQSYVDRGHYADQLRVLFDLFGRERVHVLFSEDFFETPERVYEDLLSFLDLPIIHPQAYEQFNARRSSSMADATRAMLVNHFQPHNQDLADLVGRTPPWQ